jgi:hypothetical protein
MHRRRREFGGLPRRYGAHDAVDDANEYAHRCRAHSSHRTPSAPPRSDDRDQHRGGVGAEGLAKPGRWMEPLDLERLSHRIVRIDCRIQSNGFRLQGLMGG